MRNLRGTYVHMGDHARRRLSMRRALLAFGVCVAGAGAWAKRLPAEAHAETTPQTRDQEIARLRSELDATRGELDLTQAQLDRWSQIFTYSSRYNVGASLATSVYDVALAEGIEPELGFRLVRTESQFNPRATSPVGAIGLAQVMPATARAFRRDITREALYEPRTNLRIGFRYLRGLVREHDGNLRLALLAYNRGDGAVDRDLRRGRNPENGYSRRVLGTGIERYRGDGRQVRD